MAKWRLSQQMTEDNSSSSKLINKTTNKLKSNKKMNMIHHRRLYQWPKIRTLSCLSVIKQMKFKIQRLLISLCRPWVVRICRLWMMWFIINLITQLSPSSEIRILRLYKVSLLIKKHLGLHILSHKPLQKVSSTARWKPNSERSSMACLAKKSSMF